MRFQRGQGIPEYIVILGAVGLALVGLTFVGGYDAIRDLGTKLNGDDPSHTLATFQMSAPEQEYSGDGYLIQVAASTKSTSLPSLIIDVYEDSGSASWLDTHALNTQASQCTAERLQSSDQFPDLRNVTRFRCPGIGTAESTFNIAYLALTPGNHLWTVKVRATEETTFETLLADKSSPKPFPELILPQPAVR